MDASEDRQAPPDTGGLPDALDAWPHAECARGCSARVRRGVWLIMQAKRALAPRMRAVTARRLRLKLAYRAVGPQSADAPAAAASCRSQPYTPAKPRRARARVAGARRCAVQHRTLAISCRCLDELHIRDRLAVGAQRSSSQARASRQRVCAASAQLADHNEGDDRQQRCLAPPASTSCLTRGRARSRAKQLSSDGTRRVDVDQRDEHSLDTTRTSRCH